MDGWKMKVPCWKMAYFQRLCLYQFQGAYILISDGYVFWYIPDPGAGFLPTPKTAPEKEWWQKRRWWHFFPLKAKPSLPLCWIPLKNEMVVPTICLFSPLPGEMMQPQEQASLSARALLWADDFTIKLPTFTVNLGDSKGKLILKTWPCHFELVNFDQVDTDIYIIPYYIYVNVCTYISTYLYMKDCLDTTGISGERDLERFTHLPGGRKLKENSSEEGHFHRAVVRFFSAAFLFFFSSEIFVQWVKRLVLLALHGLFLGVGPQILRFLIVDVVISGSNR